MTDDYDVGYKRPPIETRFKKGGPSPNPGGRPKATSRARYQKAFERALAAEVVVTDHRGRRKHVTKLQAIMMQLVNSTMAAKPSAKAHSLLQNVQKQMGMLAPPDPDAPEYGVMVVQPYMSPEEWEAKATAWRVPIDPLEGLPGIDHEALEKAVAEKQRLTERGYEDNTEEEP